MTKQSHLFIFSFSFYFSSFSENKHNHTYFSLYSYFYPSFSNNKHNHIFHPFPSLSFFFFSLPLIFLFLTITNAVLSSFFILIISMLLFIFSIPFPYKTRVGVVSVAHTYQTSDIRLVPPKKITADVMLVVRAPSPLLFVRNGDALCCAVLCWFGQCADNNTEGRFPFISFSFLFVLRWFSLVLVLSG